MGLGLSPCAERLDRKWVHLLICLLDEPRVPGEKKSSWLRGLNPSELVSSPCAKKIWGFKILAKKKKRKKKNPNYLKTITGRGLGKLVGCQRGIPLAAIRMGGGPWKWRQPGQHTGLPAEYAPLPHPPLGLRRQQPGTKRAPPSLSSAVESSKAALCCLWAVMGMSCLLNTLLLNPNPIALPMGNTKVRGLSLQKIRWPLGQGLGAMTGAPLPLDRNPICEPGFLSGHEQTLPRSPAVKTK